MDHPSASELAALSRDEPFSGADRVRAHVELCSECSRDLHRLSAGASNGTQTAAIGFPTAPVSTELPRGTVFGRYLVVELLGRGGMGAVYAAFDPELDRRVALKVLPLEGRDGAQSRRLLREAQALAKLSHPNVITVHDTGVSADGGVYIAMELIHGSTLSAWLDAAPRSWREVLGKVRLAGEGLWAAHRAGLVHRDFKPDNILLHRDGRVFVTDFGLAKSGNGQELEPQTSPVTGAVREPSLLSAEVTQAEHVVGTPSYMAPELFRGVRADALSDQYSFGVTLHRALFGTLPFMGYGPNRIPNPEPSAARKVPAWVRQVLRRTLSEDRRERFPSMAEALATLDKDPSLRRRQGAQAAVGLFVVAAVGLGMHQLGERRQARCADPREVARFWSPQAASVVQARLTSLPGSAAQDRAQRVVTALNDYFNRWVAQRREACEATRVRGEQSEDALELRMECLNGRRDALEQLVGVLVDPAQAPSKKTLDAVSGLPDLRECADVEGLRRPNRLPRDDATRARIVQLRAARAHASALGETGHLPAAIAEIQTVVPAAQALHYRPLEAEALITETHLLSLRSDPGTLDAARAAELAAIAGNADESAIAALAENIQLEINLRHPDEARLGVGRLNATLERLGNPDRIAWRGLKFAAYTENDPEKAEAMLRQGVAAAQRSFGPESSETARAWDALGVRMSDLQRWPTAVDALRNAVSVAEKVNGPNDALVGIHLLNLARAYRHAGDTAGAIASGERAVRVLAAESGDDAVVTNVARMNLSAVYRQMHRFDQALPLATVAAERISRQLKPSEALPWIAHDQLLAVQLAKGDLSQMRQLATALARSDELSSAHRGLARVYLALADVEDGQFQRALPVLQTELPRIHKDEDLDLYGFASFGLARALAATHGDKARVQVLLTDAESSLREDQMPLDAAAVRRWRESPTAR